MLQNPCKTLGFKKNMVYKIPPGGGGKPYPASGLIASLETPALVWYPASPTLSFRTQRDAGYQTTPA